MAAWNSTKRTVAIIAGVRSGKTVCGPLWLCREIARRGPGNYLVVGPHYKLLESAAIPEFDRLFIGKLRIAEPFRGNRRLTKAGEIKTFGKAQDQPTVIHFGHADAPHSLAALTAKAAWLDEAGQPEFKRASFVELQQRVAIHQGRTLITTTPYIITGWLRDLFDKWEAAGRNHPDIDVFQFRSIDNPTYPREEWEKAKASLPDWQFRMRHEGAFTYPAGRIYDCFDPGVHVVPAFRVSNAWPTYLGLDFGGANTAGVFFAEELASDRRTGRLFAYRVYGPVGGRSARDHVAALLKDERRPVKVAGGAKSEGQWRNEFAQAGLPMEGPNVDAVQVGIDRVYGAIQRGEMYVMKPPDNHPWAEGLNRLAEDFQNYSRELDANGQPTEDIADKETWHRLDAVRYIIGKLKSAGTTKPQAPKVIIGGFGFGAKQQPWMG